MKTQIHLNSMLRSRVNRIAHELGQRHAAEMRSKLFTELEKLAENGASLDELHANINKFERI